MADLEVDVLIVGGGGCGLASSIFLSDQGVDHLLIERHASTSHLPKAHYLNSRTMEIFRAHGVADAVYDVGMPLENCKVRYMTSLGGDGPLDRQELFTFDAFGGGTLRERYEAAAAGPPTNIPQIRLEPLLRRIAEERAPSRVRFHHELLEFDQDPGGVNAEIRDRDSGRDYTVRAKYLIGADGGKTIPARVGAVMEGTAPLAALVSSHVRGDLSEWIAGDALLNHFTRPGSRFWWGAMVPMGPTWGKHSEEWSISFAFRPDDPGRLDADEILPAIREVLNLPAFDPEILRVSEWVVDRVVADRFRFGRVFLGGDAAHRHVPTSGLGLNSAVHDSHNLAWKLGAVLERGADPGLLDSYEPERRAADLRNADWALFTFFNHAMIDAGIGLNPAAPTEVNSQALSAYLSNTPMGETLRARGQEVMSTQRTEYEALDIELGCIYESGAVVRDGTDAPAVDPMGCFYEAVTRPGHRLPHAWLQSGHERISTHDLVGPSARFVVLAGEDGADWAEAAAAVGGDHEVEIRVVRVGPDGDYDDPTGAWAAHSGLSAGGAVLVRPDNHVGARWISSPADCTEALSVGLKAILGASARV